ncbi:hypothetical protein [Jiangella muralis]|uniref:hypothetical protein n=1 Tax=Jiangella muralis TaxID=702383 RepID=UPI00069ED756|nr:hypothetical protein [Jiangella muralis]
MSKDREVARQAREREEAANRRVARTERSRRRGEATRDDGGQAVDRANMAARARAALERHGYTED